MALMARSLTDPGGHSIPRFDDFAVYSLQNIQFPLGNHLEVGQKLSILPTSLGVLPL